MPPPRRVVIAATGLALEARLASRADVVAVTNGGAQRLGERLARAIGAGACGIVSVGLAGGLDPGLRAGAMIVARSVVAGTARWPTDPAWTRALLARLPGARLADIAGVDALVGDPAEKRALALRSNASAVDMESHIAAALAAEHALPFVAFRVVVDPAARVLPAASMRSLDADGAVDTRAGLRNYTQGPRPWLALPRAAIDAAIAFAALSRGCRRLGPGLGFPDLDELLLDVL